MDVLARLTWLQEELAEVIQQPSLPPDLDEALRIARMSISHGIAVLDGSVAPLLPPD